MCRNSKSVAKKVAIFKNLYGHIIQYDMTGKEVNHYFLSAGFVDGNLVYTKKEKEEQ